MWDKDLVELLIVKYQQHENLYNVKDPLYADRDRRSNSLLEICNKLRELNNSITVEEIKKKIHTLRSQYIKESREIGNRKRSGTEEGDEHEPKLWCFHKLDFLKPHCAVRKSGLKISKIITYGERNMENESPIDSNNEPSANISYSNNRKRTLKLDERIGNVTSLLENRLTEKNDYDWLGKQVVFEMKSIKNQKIQRDTAWKIQTILREASIEDAKINESQSEPTSELHSDTQSSFGSCSSREQPMCSFSSVRKKSDVFDKTGSNIPVLPVRLITAKSYNSCSTSPDILQQSLEGLKYDEDYQCL